MTTTTLLLASLLAAAPARAAAPSAANTAEAPTVVKPSTAPSTAPAVAPSTAPARPPTVEDIFGGGKYRDPFTKLGAMGAGGPAPAAAPLKEYNPEEFSIHGLELKGIMRDRAGPVALLVESATRMTFILRGGRLLDLKKKPVADRKSVV